MGRKPRSGARAAWSMCVDPARLADYGAVEGWSMTVGALAAVSPEYFAPLLEAGFKEADANLVLARATGRSLLDSGATVRTGGAGTAPPISVAVRWSTTDAGRAAFASVLGGGLATRTDAELAAKLLRPLRAARARHAAGKPPTPPWKWRLDGDTFVGEATLSAR